MASRNTLNIWINGELVGEWSRSGGQETLKYSDHWIKSEKFHPLSVSLPFTPGNQAYRGERVKYYFDNLLPDSQNIRERLALKFNTKGTSTFDLLSEIGRDCIGAIQLLKPNQSPKNIHSILYEPLNETQVANILRKTVSSNFIGHTETSADLRLSLAGAQEKTALLWHNNQWCLPQETTPTTHILKLPLGLVGDMKADMNESVENEWLCSKIIAAFGLPIANCDIAKFEDQKTLVVERFDRKLSENKKWIKRIPQEDMCQAKGITPLLKYQSDGGPGITQCMQILDGSANSQTDKNILFAAQVIFWMLYATDGHAKNFSIKHAAKNHYELTPLYDVLSAFPVIGKKQNQIAKQKAKLAMAIRGSKNYYLIHLIQRRHFIKQAVLSGITAELANSIIDHIVFQTEKVINEVSSTLPDKFPKNMADKIFDGMLNQSKKLA